MTAIPPPQRDTDTFSELVLRRENGKIVVYLEETEGTAERRKAWTYLPNDMGNASFFVDVAKKWVRYDPRNKQWLLWIDPLWEVDREEIILEIAKLAMRAALEDAVGMPADSKAEEDARRKQLNHAARSMSRTPMENAVYLARSDRKLVVNTTNWNVEPLLVGVQNGVLNLEDGTLRKASKEDLISRHLGVSYNEHAKCPRWERFVSEVLVEPELIDYLWKALGYTLTGLVREDCWFGCYGNGSNGKSTMFNVLQYIFHDYAYNAPFSIVERSQGGRKDFDLAYLQGMRLVCAPETRQGVSWDEERLKKLTGRDVIHAEFKYGREFNFWPTHKLWFMFNHQPKAADSSEGFWRRVRLIPFTQKFGADRADTGLEAALRSEAEGILSWLVRGCLEWQKSGLTAPKLVQDASNEYRAHEDPLAEFIAKHVQNVGSGFYLRDVYDLYTQWAKGERVKALGRNSFAMLLGTKFNKVLKRNVPFYEGGSLVFVCTCLSKPCTCLGSKP